MMRDLMAKLHASFLEVDIPKPEVPDSGDIIDKGNDGASWMATWSGATWTIIVIAAVAALITAALKRSFFKGILLGVIIVGIAAAVIMGGR